MPFLEADQIMHMDDAHTVPFPKVHGDVRISRTSTLYTIPPAAAPAQKAETPTEINSASVIPGP